MFVLSDPEHVLILFSGESVAEQLRLIKALNKILLLILLLYHHVSLKICVVSM